MGIKKIKPVKRVSSTKSYSASRDKKSLLHLRRETPTTTSLQSKHTTKTALTIREHNKAIKLYTHYKKHGINIHTALKGSLTTDKMKSKTEIGGFFLNGKKYIKTDEFKSFNVANVRLLGRTDVFRFTVSASGLHNRNKYGISENFKETKHFVDIQWAIPEEVEDVDAILYLAPIKFQCSCGRFTYWYRYIATKGGFALGSQENRYPEVRNKNLDGVLCKHLIKVMTYLPKSSFKTLFEREIINVSKGKRARVKMDDKRVVHGGPS